MRTRMNQALQSSPQGGLEESGRVNELVENYMKKNRELYDIETLIPVSIMCMQEPINGLLVHVNYSGVKRG